MFSRRQFRRLAKRSQLPPNRSSLYLPSNHSSLMCLPSNRRLSLVFSQPNQCQRILNHRSLSLHRHQASRASNPIRSSPILLSLVLSLMFSKTRQLPSSSRSLSLRAAKRRQIPLVLHRQYLQSRRKHQVTSRISGKLLTGEGKVQTATAMTAAFDVFLPERIERHGMGTIAYRMGTILCRQRRLADSRGGSSTRYAMRRLRQAAVGRQLFAPAWNTQVPGLPPTRFGDARTDAGFVWGDDSALLQPAERWIRLLRRPRNRRLRSLAAAWRLQPISRGHGREAAGHVDRPDQPGRRLRAQQLQVGDRFTASSEHARQPLHLGDEAAGARAAARSHGERRCGRSGHLHTARVSLAGARPA